MASREWFAVAAIGRDRPGIVADLSECVYECGCNLEDASMTMLGSEFATLMLISGRGEDLQSRLYEATKRLEWERRLTVFLRPLAEEPDQLAGPSPRKYRLSAVGVDKAGLVARVARCLADFDVLITDLRGSVSHVPQSGTPLYTLAVRMSVPTSVDVEELGRALDAIGRALDVEVSLEADAGELD